MVRTTRWPFLEIFLTQLVLCPDIANPSQESQENWSRWVDSQAKVLILLHLHTSQVLSCSVQNLTLQFKSQVFDNT